MSTPPFLSSTGETAEVNLRLLQQAVADLSEAVLITGPASDGRQRIVYVNEAFTEITGYEPEEVTGQSPGILQGPMTSRRVLDELHTCLENGERFEGEAINYRKDGTPYVNHWSIAPVSVRGGSSYWVSVQRDVTRERQMDRHLLKAQEEERRRIAREIHDEVGGLLTTLQMSVAAARNAEPGDDAALDRVGEVATQLARTVRSTSRRMHSKVLDDYGLTRALSWLIDEIEAPNAPSITFESDLGDEAVLPEVVRNTAYRIVQEALTNAYRHAQASQITVAVEESAQYLRLRIEDDGVGFDPDEGSHETFGIDGMRERADHLGGSLVLRSTPGEGTIVVAVLPRHEVDVW